jgi:hypothetical protein
MITAQIGVVSCSIKALPMYSFTLAKINYLLKLTIGFVGHFIAFLNWMC